MTLFNKLIKIKKKLAKEKFPESLWTRIFDFNSPQNVSKLNSFDNFGNSNVF